MRRLFRLFLPLLFSCLFFFPAEALAGTVDVTVSVHPWGIGYTTGSGTYNTDTDYVDVDVWWVGSDTGCWEFDHWELTGSSVVQGYQNPANIRLFQSSGSAELVAVVMLKHERVYHGVVYPTCISDGTIEHYSCANCGKLFSDYDMTNEITPSDIVWPGGSGWHSPVKVDFQYADCENDGRKEHYWCSICQRRFWDYGCTNEVPSGDWVLPAGGHNLEYVPGKLPTCTQPGSKEYYKCLECGKWFWDSAAAYEIPAHSTEILLDPTGHNFGPWQVTKDPTCAIDGQEERTCTDCGGSESGGIEMRTIPATGFHTWGEWSAITAPTCEADGVSKRTCTVCGAEDAQPVPATGHAWGEWTITPAACEKGGERTHACATCGKTETEAIPATGHVWSDVAYKAATCTADGNAAYSVCTVCGLIVDSPSAMDVYDKIPVIPATSHAWGSWQNSKAPTCTESGTESRVCTACGDIESRGVSALGHSWGSWESIKEATCTENGEERHVCERCGAEETRTGAKALGHDWDEGEVTVKPTTTSAGVKTYTCKRCGQHRTEPIAKEKGGGSNVTPTPTPAPSPNPAPAPDPTADPGLPLPLIIAGIAGGLSLIGLIVLFILKKREEDEQP